MALLPNSQQKAASAIRRELERDPALLQDSERPPPPPQATSNVVAMPEHNLTCQPQTDAGNADRLQRLHGENLTYVHEWKAFLVWENGRWETDRSGVVERLVIDTARETYRQAGHLPKEQSKALADHARRSESARAIQATLDLARCAEGATVSAADLDSHRHLLGVRNGVVDLPTGKLLPARRNYLITKSTRAKYDPSAECECFMRFLSGALGVRPDASEGDLVKAEQRVSFIQKAIGSSFSGYVDDKVIFALFRPTNSGKTTFLEAIRWTLGDYAGQILIDSLLSNSRQSNNNSQADLAGTHGCRFVTTSEADSSQRLDAGRLKYLTQGQSTKIKVARKYENPFEFSATHKLWLDANERPKIKTVDDSVWIRLKPIPFEFRVPDSEIDLTLPGRLRDEADGILRWAVDGFRLWQEEGLGDPPDIAEARQAWREECDPLADFIAENCRLDTEAWALATQLRQRYESFCSETGEKFPMGPKAFSARLQALGCTTQRQYYDGKTQRTWAGIELI